MPIYEYKCKKCGAEFELLVKRSETPACPKCASKTLDKKISSFSAKSSDKPASCSSSKYEECSAGAHGASCGCGCRHKH